MPSMSRDDITLVEEIVHFDPPWPQAFAVRCILRAIPVLVPTLTDEVFLRGGREFLLEAARYVYLAAIRFEDHYRSRVAANYGTSPRIEEAFRDLQTSLGSKLQGLGQWRERFNLIWEVALLLAQDGRDQPYLATRMMRSLHDAITSQGVQLAFGRRIASDLEALEPLDVQEPGDMAEFIALPLWGEDGQRWVKTELGEWFRSEMILTEAAGKLAAMYEAHLVGPLPKWDEVLSIVLPPIATLSEEERTAFGALAESPERIARLLARIAFSDRTQCDLASAPSVSGFKQALRAHRRHSPAALLAFEREQSHSAGAFQPHPLWLAWMQNAGRPALEALRTELLSWVPKQTDGIQTVSSQAAAPEVGMPSDPQEKARPRSASKRATLGKRQAPKKK
jgi:hypothetical protein